MSSTLADRAEAGDWKKLSKDTLSFEGQLEVEDLVEFRKVFDDDVKTLVVDSQGGEAAGGLSIGEILQKHEITIRVRGLCMSSCANYLFIAAKHRIIEHGIVGFHGGASAYTWEGGPAQAFYESIKKLAGVEAAKKQMEIDKQLADRELIFLKNANVSPQLFLTTQIGFDTAKYIVFLPSRKTFELYGIHNVIGEQSNDVIKNDPRVKANWTPWLSR